MVCSYCRLGIAFWSDDIDCKTAKIIPGTNTFIDTAGRQINFRFCPMCGKSLLDPKDGHGGLFGAFRLSIPAQAAYV